MLKFESRFPPHFLPLFVYLFAVCAVISQFHSFLLVLTVFCVFLLLCVQFANWAQYHKAPYTHVPSDLAPIIHRLDRVIYSFVYFCPPAGTSYVPPFPTLSFLLLRHFLRLCLSLSLPLHVSVSLSPSLPLSLSPSLPLFLSAYVLCVLFLPLQPGGKFPHV